MNNLCNKVNNKFYLYDFGMIAKGQSAVNWSCEFVIVPTYFNVKKRYVVDDDADNLSNFGTFWCDVSSEK